MRLDKFIASFGFSRREATEIILKGRIKVNEIRVNTGKAQIKDTDTITLDDKPLIKEGPFVIMLNKPKGVLSATEDYKDNTVLSLLPENIQRKSPFPVGRLDKDVTGLLLLTCDGELCHRLISPKREINKEYLAITQGVPDENDIQIFSKGVPLKDFTCLPAQLFVEEDNNFTALCRVIVHEGKFHQVKRMLGSLGHEVLELKRVRFGPISLDNTLLDGEYRYLTADEISALYKAVSLDLPT